MNQTTKDGKKILKKPNLDKVVFGGTVLYLTTHNNKIISCLAIHTSSKPQTAYLCIDRMYIVVSIGFNSSWHRNS